MMPAVGLEPTRSCLQQILSLPRLPFRHAGLSDRRFPKHTVSCVFVIRKQRLDNSITILNYQDILSMIPHIVHLAASSESLAAVLDNSRAFKSTSEAHSFAAEILDAVSLVDVAFASAIDARPCTAS